MSADETVQVLGIRRDGTQDLLGTAAMPATMKAREIVQDVFGHIDEDEVNDAAMALWCCEQLIEWIEKTPKTFTATGSQQP